MAKLFQSHFIEKESQNKSSSSKYSDSRYTNLEKDSYTKELEINSNNNKIMSIITAIVTILLVTISI